MPMQNMGYGQMGPQSVGYPHSQQNSPASASQGAELVPTQQNQVAVAQQQQQQVQQTQSVPQKEVNPASFCRLGQETIQELVNKTNEMFGCLKATQPPDGRQFAAGMDRKQKLHDMLKAVKVLSKRLRIIYEKVEEAFPSSDTMDIEVQVNLVNLERKRNGVGLS